MREWLDNTVEISGFGGGYEAVCRAMVLAGMDWMDANPDAELKYKGWKDVYGVVIGADTPAVKEFEAAMMDAPVHLDGKLLQAHAKDDCTGAMHHAAVSHCMAYKRLGWDEYWSQLLASDADKTPKD